MRACEIKIVRPDLYGPACRIKLWPMLLILLMISVGLICFFRIPGMNKTYFPTANKVLSIENATQVMTKKNTTKEEVLKLIISNHYQNSTHTVTE